MERGFQCPSCFSWNTSRVLDTRRTRDGIQRTRRCSRCGEITKTLERVWAQKLYVQKRSLKRELYSEEKLRRGLESAFMKVPIDPKEIDEIVQCITEKARKKGREEITSKEICLLVLEELKGRIEHQDKKSDRSLFETVYIRFATLWFAVDGDAQKIERLSKEVVALVHNNIGDVQEA